jgi:dTDP-4-amino-4,6-dideoxygalactose transaminase
MTTPRIELVRASLGERELEAVAEVFRSGWPAGQGPQGKALEARLKSMYGVGDAVAVSNCGAALDLAMTTLGVGPGDEVIVADYTFPAPAQSVLHVGATPVLVDVLADTGTVDPAAVEAAVTPRTVGIIAVDTLGLPADYDDLQKIADQHGLFVVEDAACAVGATYHGRPAGSLADIGCLSFHGRKGLSSGEGGAVLTANSEQGQDVRRRSSFGIGSIFELGHVVGLPIPEFTGPGHNYKLSDIAAAILLVQLDRMDELHARRVAIADQYTELLDGQELWTVPRVPADRTHAWQSYLVTLDPAVDRAGVASALRAQGIGCGHGAWATHTQPAFATDRACPVSADLFRRNLAIPMHAELTESDVERVVQALTEAVRANVDDSARAGMSR